MSINFPTSLDSLPNPTNTDLMENATTALDHDQQHANANDAIEALEAKVGINGSAVTTSHDYKLSSVTGGAKALTSGTSTQSVTNLTLVTPTLTLNSDATGDMYYRNSGGALTRLPVGTAGQILDVSSGGIPEWIANPAAADATYAVKGVRVLDAGTAYYAADAGSNDSYAITLSPAPTAYATGQTFRFKANTINTGAATLNVNGLGAKTIVKGVNTTLSDGDIAAGQFCTVIYDGTNFVLQNPVANAPTTAQTLQYAVNANETVYTWLTSIIPAYSGAAGAAYWTGTWGTVTVNGNFSSLANVNHGGSDSSDRSTNLLPTVSTKGYRVKFLSKLSIDGGGVKTYQFGFTSDSCYFEASDSLGTTTLRINDGSNHDITVSSLNSTWNLYEIVADSAGVTKFYLNGTLIYTSGSHKSLSNGIFASNNSGSGSSQSLSQIITSIEL